MLEAFEKSIDSVGSKVLINDCPQQNCKKVLGTMKEVAALVFKVLTRLPDLDPIKKFSTLVS